MSWCLDVDFEVVQAVLGEPPWGAPRRPGLGLPWRARRGVGDVRGEPAGNEEPSGGPAGGKPAGGGPAAGGPHAEPVPGEARQAGAAAAGDGQAEEQLAGDAASARAVGDAVPTGDEAGTGSDALAGRAGAAPGSAVPGAGAGGEDADPECPFARGADGELVFPDDPDAWLAGPDAPEFSAARPASFLAGRMVETMGPGPGLACWLAQATLPPGNDGQAGTSSPGRGGELAELEFAALPGVAVAAKRLASWAQAVELAAVAEIASREAAADSEIGVEEDGRPARVARSATGEVSLALVQSPSAAAWWTGLACELRWRLPATLAALAAGEIDLSRARAVVEAVSVLNDEKARMVEEAVLPGAGDVTLPTLRDRLRRAVITADPDGAERRREEREARADVILYPGEESTATLAGVNLPGLAATAAFNRVTALAKARRTAGEPGSAAAMRASTLLGLLLGTLPHIPPADDAPPDAPPPNDDHGPCGQDSGGQDSGDPSGGDRDCGGAGRDVGQQGSRGHGGCCPDPARPPSSGRPQPGRGVRPGSGESGKATSRPGGGAGGARDKPDETPPGRSRPGRERNRGSDPPSASGAEQPSPIGGGDAGPSSPGGPGGPQSRPADPPGGSAAGGAPGSGAAGGAPGSVTGLGHPPPGGLEEGTGTSKGQGRPQGDPGDHSDGHGPGGTGSDRDDGGSGPRGSPWDGLPDPRDEDAPADDGMDGSGGCGLPGWTGTGYLGDEDDDNLAVGLPPVWPRLPARFPPPPARVAPPGSGPASGPPGSAGSAAADNGSATADRGVGQPSDRPAGAARRARARERVGESAPASGAAAGRGDPSRPSPGLLDVSVPWATLAGVGAVPGRLGRLGVITPAQAWQAAVGATADPEVTWRVIVTDSVGHALAVTRIPRRASRDGSAGSGTADGGRLAGRVTVTIPTAALPDVVGSRAVPQASLGPLGRVLAATQHAAARAVDERDEVQGVCLAAAKASRVTGDSGAGEAAGAAGEAAGAARGAAGAARAVGGECGHWLETSAYRPGPRLREHVNARDVTCRLPTCRQPAWRGDLDHTKPYQQGGRTCSCNLGARCRSHHILKQHPRWRLDQPWPEEFAWTTPAGRVYTTGPDAHPV
jgi:hypothetical protein